MTAHYPICCGDACTCQASHHMYVGYTQGWNPVTVLLVGALLVVSGVAWYANSQAAMHKLAYSQLLTSSHEKQVQVSLLAFLLI